jgi:hypothetical protein
VSEFLEKFLREPQPNPTFFRDFKKFLKIFFVHFESNPTFHKHKFLKSIFENKIFENLNFVSYYIYVMQPKGTSFSP